MFNLLTIYLMSMLISSIMLYLNFMLSKKLPKNREKMSPFECGFDPFSSKRLPFSIQFFLISLLFMIFDIEITLLIPLVYSLKNFNLFTMLPMMIFLLILLISLYLKYTDSSLDWNLWD